MGGTTLLRVAVFLLFLILGSGSNVEEKPPSNTNIEESYQTKHTFFTTSKSDTILDVMSPPATIPIVNPTPTTTTPIVNPTPPSTPTYTDQPTAPTTTTAPTTSSGTWCIASQTASPTALQVALDYACGYGGADCSAIQPGGTCYNPNTVRDHASYAFNNYYQKTPIPTSCVFGGTAQLSTTDPSSGSCHYTSSSSTSTISTPPPPSTSSSIFPSNPGGATVYGTEPTGTPNSATSIALSLVLHLITVNLLLGWHVAASYL